MTPEQKGAVILVVDDVEASRYGTAELLRRNGYRVIEAASGQEALAKAAQNPDIVLLDINLPDIDGFEVCARLQNDIRTSTIPVVHITSTYGSSDYRLRGLSGGAAGYLTHPFLPQELLATVCSLLRLRQAEERVKQMEKMESIGLLAGGLAHDFNNLLTIILGYSRMILDEAGLPGPYNEYMEEIHQTSQHAADLTQRLLSFTRRQMTKSQVFDLNRSVEDMLKMIRRLVGSNIVIETKYLEKPANVRGDPAQIDQVLLNLAVNARDAIADESGTLRIEIKETVVENDYPLSKNGLVAGPTVYLVVSDSGTGIDPAIKDRIFDPFFTTKGRDRGTGLGLTTVFGVIKRHGGFIDVESSVGVGTTFAVYLPRVLEEQPAAPVRNEHLDLSGGGETVLLVEDDPSILSFARIVMTRAGYNVITAASGTAALRVSREHSADTALLVSDLVMPGLGGVELARRLEVERPAMGIVLISGYAFDQRVSSVIQGPGRVFLEKPFTRVALLGKLRQVLNEMHQRAPPPS